MKSPDGKKEAKEALWQWLSIIRERKKYSEAPVDKPKPVGFIPQPQASDGTLESI